MYRRTGYNFQKKCEEKKEFFIEPFLETLKQKYPILEDQLKQFPKIMG